jgi:hypothetical protein
MTKAGTQCKNAAKEHGVCATHAPGAKRRGPSSTKGKLTDWAVFSQRYNEQRKEEGLPYDASAVSAAWKYAKENKTEEYLICQQLSDYAK